MENESPNSPIISEPQPENTTPAVPVISTSPKKPISFIKVIVLILVIIAVGVGAFFGIKQYLDSKNSDLNKAANSYVSFAKNIREKKFNDAFNRLSKSFRDNLSVGGLEGSMKTEPFSEITDPDLDLRVTRKDRKTILRKETIVLTVKYSKNDKDTHLLKAYMVEEKGQWLLDNAEVKKVSS